LGHLVGQDFLKSSFNGGGLATHKSLHPTSFRFCLYLTLSNGSYKSEIWDSQDAECEDNWPLSMWRRVVSYMPTDLSQKPDAPSIRTYGGDSRFLCSVHTNSRSCTSICFTPLSFNTPCKLTPFLNLRSYIFGITPFAWLGTSTRPVEHKSHGVE
jgi:hypothetical protein